MLSADGSKTKTHTFIRAHLMVHPLRGEVLKNKGEQVLQQLLFFIGGRRLGVLEEDLFPKERRKKIDC